MGKRAAIAEANKPIRKTLRPCKAESKNWDTTENLYIEGDNLEVLKLLQESYLGKVKMIYIDPPYNTGNDFIYRDDFKQTQQEYDEQAGLFDEDENRLFKNTETNGRFHSDWCSMMYSRLMLAKNFLSDDGVIFISIDDNELENLKKICDEVFGASNFVNLISLKTKVAGVSGSYFGKSLQNNVEYILLYTKSISNLFVHKIPQHRQELMNFINSYEINNKSWKYTSVIKSYGKRKYIKSFKAGNGDEIKLFSHSEYEILPINKIAEDEFNGNIKNAYYKYIDNVFRTTNAQTSIRKKVIIETEKIESNLVSIDYIPTKGKNAGEKSTIYYKDKNRNMITFLKDVVSIDSNIIYKLDNIGNLWTDINYNNLFNESEITFSNGQKPVQLLKRIIEIFDNENMIALDFFSGSATSAHAVMQLNAEDGGHRKFIMVQLPEVCDEKSEAYKAGYKNICEIGKERLRRAGEKIKADNPLTTQDLDIGFRVFKVDSSNMNDVYYSAGEYSQDMLVNLEDNIKPDRTDLDLLFGCLLDWGLPISLPYTSEQIENCTVHTYNDGDLVACFDENIPESVIKEIAKRKPLRAVFRDAGFGSSPEKINVTEIFKMLAPDTDVKVI